MFGYSRTNRLDYFFGCICYTEHIFALFGEYHSQPSDNPPYLASIKSKLLSLVKRDQNLLRLFADSVEEGASVRIHGNYATEVDDIEMPHGFCRTELLEH